MRLPRWFVTVTRNDRSTITSAALARPEVMALLEALLERDVATGLRKVALTFDTGQDVTDDGPILPLEQALVWRQPDDAATALMQRLGGRN